MWKYNGKLWRLGFGQICVTRFNPEMHLVRSLAELINRKCFKHKKVISSVPEMGKNSNWLSITWQTCHSFKKSLKGFNTFYDLAIIEFWLFLEKANHNSRVAMVYFLGGCTFSEITALRFLAKQRGWLFLLITIRRLIITVFCVSIQELSYFVSLSS